MIGCSSESDMNQKRYQIKKLMESKGDVEFIYKGLPFKIKPYVAERVVDTHPQVKGMYAGGIYRDYCNLTVQSKLDAFESFQSAIQLYQHQFNEKPEYILIVQV